MGRQWYVAYCHVGKERLAVEQLLAQDFAAYLPLYKKMARHARSVCVKKVPLFPRYLFVGFDIQSERWRSVNYTRGVVQLIMLNGELPKAVSSTVIDDLRNTEDEEGFVSLAALNLFKFGQKVRLLDGAFTGCIATYQKMTSQQRVEILLDFLNQDVRLEVFAHEIEKVE